MAIRALVTYLSGDTFVVEADDTWRVRDLKLAVQAVTQTPSARQKLVSDAGSELQDHVFLRECGGVEQGALEVTLVVMPKPQAELDWLERWRSTTPAWLVLGTQKIHSSEDLRSLGLAPRRPKRVSIGRVSEKAARMKRYPGFCWESADQEEERPCLSSAEGVLAALRRGKRGDAVLYGQGDVVHVEIGRWQAAGVTAKWFPQDLQAQATRSAVQAACELAPHIVMPRVDCESLAAELVARRPGAFQHLPKTLQESRGVLFSALACDEELLEEFLRTASKRELWEWQEHRSYEEACAKRRRRRGRR